MGPADAETLERGYRGVMLHWVCVLTVFLERRQQAIGRVIIGSRYDGRLLMAVFFVHWPIVLFQVGNSVNQGSVYSQKGRGRTVQKG